MPLIFFSPSSSLGRYVCRLPQWNPGFARDRNLKNQGFSRVFQGVSVKFLIVEAFPCTFAVSFTSSTCFAPLAWLFEAASPIDVMLKNLQHRACILPARPLSLPRCIQLPYAESRSHQSLKAHFPLAIVLTPGLCN